MDIDQRLQQASRSGLETQANYERIVNEIATVRLQKVTEYGEERYSDEWTEEEHVWMVWSDLYRKWIRIRRQRDRMDLEGMRETLMDLANYAIMGVQIIDRIMVRRREQEDGSDS